MIRLQREDFDVGAEIDALTRGRADIGGVCSFVGQVREVGEGGELEALVLEHYPAMTERQLADIEAEACRRWPLTATLIIHRYGRLKPAERIVLVVAASAHRDAAFEACRFMIDWLKTKAPFWKLEETAAGGQWVEARDSDDRAARQWESAAGKPDAAE